MENNNIKDSQVLPKKLDLMQSIYDSYLTTMIPMLKTFERKKGTEGTAFFVDDKLIIKRYKNLEPEFLSRFPDYCREIAEFAEQGLSVPRIYAYRTVHNKNGDVYSYILEERVSGKEIYEYDYLDLSYDLFKNMCSENEFELALREQNNLYYEILNKYFNYFIEANEKITSISDDEIEKFVESVYKMVYSAKQSSADIQVGNVFNDGKKLTIIDNYFVQNEYYRKPNRSKIKTMNDVILLFDPNADLTRIIKHELKDKQDSFIRLNNINRKICSESLKRFAKKVKLVIGDVKLDKSSVKFLLGDLDKILDKNSLSEVCHDLGLNL